MRIQILPGVSIQGITLVEKFFSQEKVNISLCQLSYSLKLWTITPPQIKIFNILVFTFLRKILFPFEKDIHKTQLNLL